MISTYKSTAYREITLNDSQPILIHGAFASFVEDNVETFEWGHFLLSLSKCLLLELNRNELFYEPSFLNKNQKDFTVG